MVAAVHVRRGGTIPFIPWLAGAAAFYVVLAFLWVRVPLWGIDVSFGMPRVLTGFDKTYLSAPRLLHVLAAAYLIVAIPRLSALARTAPDNPLAILGRHALPVFIAGTLLSMVAQVLKHALPATLALDTVLIAGGIAAQFALAYWLNWLPTIGWGGKAVPAKAKAESVPGAAKPSAASAVG